MKIHVKITKVTNIIGSQLVIKKKKISIGTSTQLKEN